MDTNAIRRDHFQSPHGDCHMCGDEVPLPCDAIRLCDELDKARAESTVEWDRAELWREKANVSAAAIDRVREILLNPPVPSRMLIPFILDALNGDDQ